MSYLASVLDCEDSVVRAVRARIVVVWTKWREMVGLLTNKGISIEKKQVVSMKVVSC